MTDRIGTAVVGAGYWGPNVIRTLSAIPDCAVLFVCDREPSRLDYVRRTFANVVATADFGAVLADPRVEAVCVVTPVSTHRSLAEAAIRAGKHVFIEKPLAATIADAEAVVALAESERRVVAVGHVFVHHPAVRALDDVLVAAALGQQLYASSIRVNLGPPASEVDVIWDLAVHDLSILCAIHHERATSVEAFARRLSHTALADVAFVRVHFGSGFFSEHHVSWLSAVRSRRFFIAGSEGSAIFDDLASPKLTIAGKGEDARLAGSSASALSYGPGELVHPPLDPTPPLDTELRDFLGAIRERRRARVGGEEGIEIVRLLAAASDSAKSGQRVGIVR